MNKQFNGKKFLKLPEWLEPFKFEYEVQEIFRNKESSAINATNYTAINETNTTLTTTNRSILSTITYPQTTYIISTNFTTNQPTFINKTYSNTSSLISASLTTNQSISEQKIDYIDNSIRLTKNSTKIIKPNSIIKYEGCEHNLTKLTMFYGLNDYITCEKSSNQSVLKCIDEILVKKLVSKFDSLYFVQLQPLYIENRLLKCETLYNQSFFHSSKNISLNLIRVYNYTKFKIKNGSICNLKISFETNRIKLVWTLHLIFKNQTCFKSASLIDDIDGFKSLNFSYSLLNNTVKQNSSKFKYCWFFNLLNI